MVFLVEVDVVVVVVGYCVCGLSGVGVVVVIGGVYVDCVVVIDGDLV